MNRTALFLVTAAALALAALLPWNRQTSQPATRAAPVAAATPTSLVPPPGATSRPAIVSAGAGSATLEAKLVSTHVLSGASTSYAWLQVKATETLPPRNRGPVAIVAVVDRSGSMAGQKLEDARRAALHLVDRMRDGDYLGIIHYGSDVQEIAPVRVDSASREMLRSRILSIADNGGTNIGAALDRGEQLLARLEGAFTSRRLILLSDGQPTEGETRGDALKLQAARIREHGVAVSALGIGVDFDQMLMQGLAQRGGGFYGYLRDAAALSQVFDKELQQAVQSVAQSLDLRLVPARGVHVKQVFGYPTQREGAATRVTLYDLAPGQWASVLVELAIDGSQASGELPVLEARLSYVDALRFAPAAAAVALSATATASPDEVQAGLDPEVHAAAVRAAGAQQLQAAAAAYERGDRQGAFGIFANVRELFAASGDALAGDVASLDRDREALEGATAPEDVAHQAKSLAKKNLSNFGANNAY